MDVTDLTCASDATSAAQFVDLTDYTGLIGNCYDGNYAEEKKNDASFLLEDNRYKYTHPALQSKQEKMIHIVQDFEDADVDVDVEVEAHSTATLPMSSGSCNPGE